MRFTRTTRLAVLPLLLYGTIGGQATDYRLLYTIPAKDTMATFRVRWVINGTRNPELVPSSIVRVGSMKLAPPGSLRLRMAIPFAVL
jgi:hypothetical protein